MIVCDRTTYRGTRYSCTAVVKYFAAGKESQTNEIKSQKSRWGHLHATMGQWLATLIDVGTYDEDCR